MAVTIVLNRVDATFADGVWSCPDERMLRHIGAYAGLCPIKDRADPEWAEALWIANRIGAAVIPREVGRGPVSPLPSAS